MSGQYPGQFGPPPGGAVPGGAFPGGIPDAMQPTAPMPMAGHYPQPGPMPAAAPPLRPGMAAGPYGVLGKVLCAVTPVVTVGLLGMIPSLLLAIRRRRWFDILGAVVFAGLFLTYLVGAGVAGNDKSAHGADTAGMTAMLLMWFGAPLHYLLMDSRALWNAARPQPTVLPTPPGYYPPPASPYAQTAPVMPYAPPPGYATPAPVSMPNTAPTPAPAPPAAAPAAPPAASDDLRELGELLRRQAREGRP
ncbi:hypothetical protein ACFVVX_35910 [Kitasatospora sp. NPDC058170]|uniref:hypothetical protein n=1 Tax=Kitasatospora sp. NPDC058170 TaxID=3346364 RepID=UPI0036D8EB35